MKTSKPHSLHECQSRATQKLSASQLNHTVLANVDHVQHQPKSLVRIEATIHWSTQAGRIGTRRVFYRKPHLTSEGKLDWRRLALETLSPL